MMGGIESPAGLTVKKAVWGSDHIADLLRDLGFTFVALNPGSSFRGLHDSLVNHLGNENPSLLLCLHEEHAVAIAHGWAKVTGRPMAVALHSNVGLMHASMAIYNAWCDRVPMMILGGGGPLDAAKRRPWIDWIHSARDQGALVRPFVKWDDHPGSVAAAQEALLRGSIITRTAPCAPIYISLDVPLQEEAAEAPARPNLERFAPPDPAEPSAATVAHIVGRLEASRRPLLLLGRGGRGEKAWRARMDLADRFDALVLTDLKQAAAFPTGSSRHAAPAGIFPTPETLAVVRESDLLISLDWVDLGGLLTAAFGNAAPSAGIIHASVDQHVHNGFSFDHFGLPPADVRVLCEPDVLVTALLAARPGRLEGKWLGRIRPALASEPAASNHSAQLLDATSLARTLRDAVGGQPVCLIRVPLSWPGSLWPVNHPLDFLGYDGGAGIGSGPGMAVGAALALKEAGRLPLAVLGDGDFLMGVTALWTATRYRIPLLVVVANNRSFFNDEMHQERVAIARGRPVENRWIGQRISGPDIDLAAMARAQGALSIGPVHHSAALLDAMREAIAAVQAGQVAVIDVRIATGYSSDFNSSSFG